MMSGRGYPRGPAPSDVPHHRDPRRVADGRNGGFAGPGDGAMSRAEKFEDEKRRIIQSSFSKKDNDGALVESYITHVRITEDASYPSAPPPPNSPPEGKKPRVIIVSVRRSGRVRMHKARENNDGTFSIGKTWMLDDLSSIQSYSAWTPAFPMEQQQKQWAGSNGFTVTVGKPYYWHARSSKEKEFFIGSLVKIYRKYTGGKVPNLIGFDDRERHMLVGSPVPGSSGSRPPVQAPPRPEATLPPLQPPSHGSQPQSPYSSRTPSRDGPAPQEFRRPPPDELAVRAQRSRDQMGRPSTGQSGKSAAAPPFAPPQQTPPGIPSEQPPPRATERLAAETRAPKPPALFPEPRSKESPKTLLAASAIGQTEIPPRRSEDSSLASPQPETRPSVSREGKPVPEPIPPLRTLDPSSGSPKRSKDGLRPTTPASISSDNRFVAQSPASSFGPKSPLNESTEKLSPLEARAPSRSTDTVNGLPSVEVPPALKPTSPSTGETPGTPISAVAHEDESNRGSPTVSVAAVPSEPENPDAHRPGLGPMIKKKQSKDVAGAFRKAATAYGAFKPRPGGAGERLLAAAKKQQADPDEPDGITSVVPAPSLVRTGTDQTLPETPDREEPPSLASPTKETPPIVPQEVTVPKETPPASSPALEPPVVEVTRVATETTTVTTGETQESTRDTSRAAVKILADERARSVSPSPNRRRRREDNTLKYCQALGIDPTALEGRGIDFDDILTDLGWNGRLSDEKKIEDLEADVRREIGRVEATSWLGNLEQQEGKVDQLAKLIDRTVEECEELDGLLTLYSHELNTLHDDVAYIETQSQGLQVQTANQKLLQNELQNLLKTLSISSDDLRPLKEASLSNVDGLRDTEIALSMLYKAMLMIDADIWQNKKRLVDAAGDHGSVGIYADTEIGQMRAIKEKKVEYRSESRTFLQRLRQFMSVAYKMAEQKRVDVAAHGPKEPMKVDGRARDSFRQELWVYNALMLFAREVSTPEWHNLINLYEQQAKPSYQNEFRDNGGAWRKAARKATGFEQELLFTHQEKEKENESITMAARKLTVKRGKTIKAAAGLRLSTDHKQNGKLEPCEAFAGTLRHTLETMSEEHNFIVHFFHLNSLVNTDFPDLVASAHPEERRRPDFSSRQTHDPDRGMAKKVEQIMDDLFSFWPTDMQNLVDWAVKLDPLQGIGILFALEKAMADFDDTNQEFLIHSLQKLHSRLVGLFNRFVDEQIRGIEETKVKVNKRKGVISFMRVFPNFSTAVENMLSQPSQEFYDVRISVNDAYDRINRAMWESLKFIAKEAPGQTAAAGTGAGDPEDKEILNYHILLIENMNHYIEEVDVRGLPVLERWCNRAHQDLQEHMRLYLDAVIHRPLGKLLEFVESTENLMTTSAHPTEVASRASHTRSVAKKVLAMYDAKEIKRGIEMLKKRVEKHFGDADDPGLSRSLVLKVLRECEVRYEDAHDRTRHIIDTVYEGQLELEWRKEEAIAMFKKA